MSFSRPIANLFALSVVCLLAPCASAQPRLRAIAQSDQPAPGADPGTVFLRFARPHIGNLGRVAFGAALKTAGPGYDWVADGLWTSAPADPLTLVALSGTQVPGLPPGNVFQDWNGAFGGAATNFVREGRVLFGGSVIGLGTDPLLSAAAWVRDSDGTFRTVLATDLPSGLNSIDRLPVWFDIDSSAFDTSGSAVLSIVDALATASSAYWNHTGEVRALALSGDSNPFHDGAVISDCKAAGMSASGQACVNVLFDAGQSADAAFAGATGAVSPLLLAGQPPPGGPPDWTIQYASVDGMDSAGNVCVWARLRGPVGQTTDTVYLRAPDGSLSTIAQQGAHAPGTPDGAVFDASGLNGAAISGGFTTFLGSLQVGHGGVDASNQFGLWQIASNGAPTVIVRGGQTAPGLPAGAVFNYPSVPAVNSHGQAVFTAYLAVGTGGVTFDTAATLWLFDPSRGIRLIARVGDPIQVSRNDSRVVADWAYSPGSDESGMHSSFNARGELALSLKFADGSSGVFVYNTACPGDFDHNGSVNILDITAFVSTWFMGEPLGDFNGDGHITTDDMFTFLSAWFSAC